MIPITLHLKQVEIMPLQNYKNWLFSGHAFENAISTPKKKQTKNKKNKKPGTKFLTLAVM